MVILISVTEFSTSNHSNDFVIIIQIIDITKSMV